MKLAELWGSRQQDFKENPRLRQILRTRFAKGFNFLQDLIQGHSKLYILDHVDPPFWDVDPPHKDGE